MATRKAKQPTTAKAENETPPKDTTPTEAPSDPAPEAASAPGAAEQATQLAADARTLATDTQLGIAALNDRCAAFVAAAAPEHPATAAAARRLPAATTDLIQALKAYAGAAADLAATAQR